MAARTYGDSYLRLKSSVKLRCTMTVGPSADVQSVDELATFDHCAHVVSKWHTLISNGLSEGNYKRVQIHGPIRLQEDVEALVLHENHRASPHIVQLAGTPHTTTYNTTMYLLATGTTPSSFLTMTIP